MNLGKPPSNSPVLRVSVGIISLVLLISFLFTSPILKAQTRLSLSYPETSGLALVHISGFELGLATLPEGSGLGLSLGDDRSLSLGNWKFSPSVSGMVNRSGSVHFTGGLEASYFDYRIGGWAVSSSSRVWIGSDGYRVGSEGSYTLGNLNLAYDVQLDPGSGGNSIWYPVKEGNYWTSLAGKDFSGFGNVAGSYLTLFGERNFSFGEGNLKWSQGVVLDSRGDPGTLGLVTRLGYRGSFFLAEVDNLSLDGWALQLTGGKLSIGFAESSGEPKEYGISIGYRGDRRFQCKIIRNGYNSEINLNLTVEW